MDILSQAIDIMKEKAIKISVKIWGEDREKKKFEQAGKEQEAVAQAVNKYKEQIQGNKNGI